MNKDYIKRLDKRSGSIKHFPEVSQNISTKEVIKVSERSAIKSKADHAKDRVWELLKTYAPEGHYILKEYYNAPLVYKFPSQTLTFGDKTDFISYLEGYTEEEVVASLPTIVHKINHGYTSLLAFREMEKERIDNPGNRHELFYIRKNKSILVPRTRVFNSSELDQIIPKKFHTSRYFYIHPSSGLKSHLQGIYGLVDEWNAYYHGTKTAVELFDYFNKKPDKRQQFIRYLKTINNQYTAYAEFKYYILNYLLYAKQSYPDIYKSLMNNKPLMDAIVQINTHYKNINRTYFNRQAEMCRVLQKEGIRCEQTRGGMRIGRLSLNMSKEDYALLMDELEKREYRRMWDRILKKSSKN